MNGKPPWSAGRDWAEKGRTVTGASSQSARDNTNISKDR